MNCKTCKNKNRFCDKESLELGYCDYHQTHTGNFERLKTFDREFPVLTDGKGKNVAADVRRMIYDAEVESWIEGYDTANKDSDNWNKFIKHQKQGGATA